MAKPNLKSVPTQAQAPGRNSVKACQLAIGTDLIGSKMSVEASKFLELEATAIGIHLYSKKTNRHVVIPYSNVKGFELFAEGQPCRKSTVTNPELVTGDKEEKEAA